MVLRVNWGWVGVAVRVGDLNVWVAPLEIARVLPGKRNRWLKLAQHHRPLFDRAIELLGLEFFEDLLSGYGDFDSPLWNILEEYRNGKSDLKSAPEVPY